MHAPAPQPPQPTLLQPLQVQAAHLLAAGHSYSQVCPNPLHRPRHPLPLAAGPRLRRLPPPTAPPGRRSRHRPLHPAPGTRPGPAPAAAPDPNTPLKLRLLLACRIAALYSKPQHLKYLQSLPEDPQLLAEAQARQAAMLSGLNPDELDGSDIELYQAFQSQRLQHAQAFDARYPNPDALLSHPRREPE